MLYVILSLLIGLSLLFAGAHFLVKNSVIMAKRLNISNMLISVTIVSIGTSMPEAIISLEAALNGHPDIVIGNIIGSNIANLLLVLPCAAIIQPILIEPKKIRLEWIILIMTTILFYLMCISGTINIYFGLILILGCVAFNFYLIKFCQRLPEDIIKLQIQIAAPVQTKLIQLLNSLWFCSISVVASIVTLLYGSHLFVQASVEISRIFGVTEGVVGLTLVALGSSAPEIFTSIIAAKRGHSDIAVGNVVGSNIFNILGITGLTALVADIPVSSQFTLIDFGILIAASIGILLYMNYKRGLGKFASATLLSIYFVYLFHLYS